MANWEEIKFLAADFQRVQLTSAKQKLSERNIVEIVSKLIQLKFIDVIYTTDGKEYLTHQQLIKEIEDELIVHGGRIEVVDLQQLLNVDLCHIQSKVEYIASSNKSYSLVLGQLISNSYKNHLAEEINDKLNEHGYLTIAELTKVYNLPADFITNVISQRLGVIIKGQLDHVDQDLFTLAYVAKLKAKIKGSFTAATRPTQIATLMMQFNCKERLFLGILQKLITSGRLPGYIMDSRSDRPTYMPTIYTESQNEWVQSFLKQNGYLEYDSLVRLGVSDVKSYIRKMFKNQSLTFLKTCCVGPGLLDQIDANVEEVITSGGWIDIMTVMPTVLGEKDVSQLLTSSLKGRPGIFLCCDTIIASESIVTDCSKPFPNMMHEKARKDAKSNPVFLITEDDKKGASVKPSGLDDGSTAREDKKDQRKKKAAAATKTGGGTQGREVKVKATKKKYRTGKEQDDNSDDDSMSSSRASNKPKEVTFMSMEEICDVIRRQEILQDSPEELIEEIASKLHRPLTRQYQEVAKSVFQENAGTATGADRKRAHKELKEKLVGLWVNAKLFEKGLKHFTGDGNTQLVKYLLNTVCNDITNIVLNTLATDSLMSVIDESSLTPENRVKIISSLPSGEQTLMTKLHMSVTGKNLESFFATLDTLSGPDYLGVMLKKPDKKKEKQLVFGHRQTLLQSMNDETDAAMTLHLVAVLLFQTFTHNMLHVPGRMVPQVTEIIRPFMEADSYKTLIALQELIVKQAKLQSDGAGDASALGDVINEIKPLLPQVKEIAITVKKAFSAKEDESET